MLYILTPTFYRFIRSIWVSDLGMHTRRWWSYVFSVNPINSKVMNAVRMAYPGRFQSAARVVNAKPSIDNAPGNADRSTKRSCYEGSHCFAAVVIVYNKMYCIR